MGRVSSPLPSKHSAEVLLRHGQCFDKGCLCDSPAKLRDKFSIPSACRPNLMSPWHGMRHALKTAQIRVSYMSVI